jgi:Thioredoxin reductase
MKKISQTDVLVVGAGPVGLFAVFSCGQLGLRSHLVDALDAPGGQCTALYPMKPIYDVPAFPEVSGKELVDRLLAQMKPYRPPIGFSGAGAATRPVGWSVACHVDRWVKA